MLNVLNVLGRLVAVEPAQAALLDVVCGGRLIDVADVTAGVGDRSTLKRKRKDAEGATLFAE